MKYKVLTKADIKLIRSLADRSARRETGLFVVEGAKMVGEAVASGFSVKRIFVAKGVDTAVLAIPSGIQPEDIAQSEMERISHMKTPPGILALAEIPKYDKANIIFQKELILALDGVQDPGNLGTIIRTADWFGIGNIICSPESVDCYAPKVVQATMGALFRVAVNYTALPALLKKIRSKGISVYGTTLDGKNIYDAELGGTGVVVMGSESHGISPETAGLLSDKLLIPQYPAGRCGSESLNVATAAAIVCSEFRRRI